MSEKYRIILMWFLLGMAALTIVLMISFGGKMIGVIFPYFAGGGITIWVLGMNDRYKNEILELKAKIISLEKKISE